MNTQFILITKQDVLFYLSMKSIFLTLICILSVLQLRSQIKLKTNITSDHKLLKNSKIFIIPPPGFRLSFNLLGYGNNETGATFGVIQSDKSFKSAKSHLSKEYLLSKKYKIIEILKYKINEMSAVWYELESEFYDRITTKYILIIGNKNEHAMIEAYCPKEYPLASLALRKSIFTSYYDIDSIKIKKMVP